MPRVNIVIFVIIENGEHFLVCVPRKLTLSFVCDSLPECLLEVYVFEYLIPSTSLILIIVVKHISIL